MAGNVMDTLRERGFIKQTVYEEDLYKLLGSESVPFLYRVRSHGRQPARGAFHAVDRNEAHAAGGHRPIVLIGGGTGMIGDPSGRTDMRLMMTREDGRLPLRMFQKADGALYRFRRRKRRDHGQQCRLAFEPQLYRFSARDRRAFLRQQNAVGGMLQVALRKGLSFFEFNYMLMQAYDFLVLFKKYGCRLELGGDDQWSNILAGADLIRRKERQPAFAMTFTLLTTSDGKKMGKTGKGRRLAGRKQTSPYEFYQYWRNTDDADVEKCFKLLTFLPLEEIAELCAHKDERMNAAKERLAYELTKMVHGEEKADAARGQAKAAFGGDAENMPSAQIPRIRIRSATRSSLRARQSPRAKREAHRRRRR